MQMVETGRMRCAPVLLTLLAVLALTACGGGGGSSGVTGVSVSLNQPPVQPLVPNYAEFYVATLTGAQAIPAWSTFARGVGTVTVNPVTGVMTATVTTTGFLPTAVYIQQGPPGFIGPILFPLYETVPGSGIWTVTAPLREQEYTALRFGELYFSAYSAPFGQGEIRGQIFPRDPLITDAVPGSSIGGEFIFAK